MAGISIVLNINYSIQEIARLPNSQSLEISGKAWQV
jgi:hypothetical protein